MLIVAVGLNHRTASVMVREKLSFGAGALEKALKQLKAYPAIQGCAILSTCNRTEVYAATTEADEGLNAVRDFLSGWSGVDVSEIINITYCHTLYDAARHLFRVTAGLDSMLLGETEILGQVREAYQSACDYNTTNRIINTLFQQALAIGKRVRTETGIDRNAVSISYAAVELAKSRLGDLSGCTALIIGAGKMSELASKHLAANNVASIIVANRSFNRAESLAAQVSGIAIKFDELDQYLEKVDIVISSTAAPHCVLRTSVIDRIIEKRAGRAMVMIDLAVPRDIETSAGELTGVSLYDIDALEVVVDRNLAERKRAAIKAEKIIEEELSKFIRWLGGQFVVPTITSLKQRGEEIKQNELRQAFNRLPHLSEHDKKVVVSLANGIVNQLLHTPVAQLKNYALTNEGHLYTEMLQNIFCLNVNVSDQENTNEESGVGPENNAGFA